MYLAKLLLERFRSAQQKAITFFAAHLAESSLRKELACGPVIELLHRSCNWLKSTERAARFPARAPCAGSQVGAEKFAWARNPTRYENIPLFRLIASVSSWSYRSWWKTLFLLTGWGLFCCVCVRLFRPTFSSTRSTRSPFQSSATTSSRKNFLKVGYQKHFLFIVDQLGFSHVIISVYLHLEFALCSNGGALKNVQQDTCSSSSKLVCTLHKEKYQYMGHARGHWHQNTTLALSPEGSWQVK